MTQKNDPLAVSLDASGSGRLFLVGHGAMLLVALVLVLACRGDYSTRLVSCVGIYLMLVCCVSAITDILWRKIYNVVTYPAFVCLLLISFVPYLLPKPVAPFLGAIGLGDAFVGAGCCFFVTLVPYVIAQGGAGDVKLATVIGAGMGFADGLLTLCISFILAGVFGIILVILLRGPLFVAKTFGKRLCSFVFPPEYFAQFIPTSFYFTDDEEKRLLKQPLPLAPWFGLATLGMLSGSWQQLLRIA